MERDPDGEAAGAAQSELVASQKADVEKARAQWRDGHKERALGLLDEVIARDEGQIGLWSTRGLWLEELGRFDEALTAFRRSTALEPTYPDHYNAGNMLLALARFEEAIVEFDASIAVNDEYPECWVNRGFAMTRLGRPDDARACFDRALSIDAQFVPALRCQAILAADSGHPGEAEELFARIAALRPDAPGPALELARALAKLAPGGRLDMQPEGREWKAIEAANRAIELLPSKPEPKALKAMVLGRLMHANVAFRVTKPGKGGGVEFEYVAGPLATGRFLSELVAVCEAALAVDPDDAWFAHRLATAHEFAGDGPKAAELFRRACELDPENGDYHCELALTLAEVGDMAEAAEVARRAVSLDASLRRELREVLESGRESAVWLAGLGSHDFERFFVFALALGGLVEDLEDELVLARLRYVEAMR